MPDHVTCPACGLPDQVEKVSAIYIAGIEQRRYPNTPAEQRVPIRVPAIKDNLAALSQRLRPPSGERKSFTRPLHPDMVVLVFSVIIPVFLWGMWGSQRSIVLPAVIILGVIYLLYFWRRKTIILKFERQRARRQTSEQRIRMAVENWLELFYCAREDIAFYPDSSEQIPADELIPYLLKE